MKPTLSKKEMAQVKLRHVDDSMPGISRKKRGKGWSYYDADNKLINDKAEIQRINSIGIPPAYRAVWISPFDNGHIQAVGYDAKDRKQYRYHANWRKVRDQNKFEHVIAFGEKLSAIRARIESDMAKK